MKKIESRLCPGCLMNGYFIQGDLQIIDGDHIIWFCGTHYNLRLQYDKDEKK